MVSFLCAVAWYYIVATAFYLVVAIKDKSAGKEMDFSDINLDLSVIAIIYLFYYYLGLVS